MPGCETFFGGGFSARRDAAPDSRAIQFEHSASVVYATSTLSGTIRQYGPTSFFTVPAQIQRTSITHLAVVGFPDSLWLSHCWWTISATQQFVASSLLADPDALGIPAGYQTPVSGLRGFQYGSLLEPQAVGIDLQQGMSLEVTVYSDFAQSLPLALALRLSGFFRSSGE